jgi:flagellar hook-basal body complex protein FliE
MDLRIPGGSPATSLPSLFTKGRPITTSEIAHGVDPLTPLSPSAPTTSAALSPFGTAFREAIGRALVQVNTMQLDAERAARDLASGKTTDMTEAVVSMEKASISFQFALQIRNKLLEAYQDIMRMSV